MQEPSGKTGNTITKVSVGKTAKISLGSRCFTLSLDSYLDFPLYVGKELTTKEYKRLVELSKTQEAREKASKMLTKGNKSSKEILEALLNKTDYRTAKSIIDEYQRLGYIDDISLSKDLIESYSYSLYGKRHIIDKVLYPKGLSNIESLAFPDQKELAKQAYASLIRKYEGYPLIKRKAKISEALLRRGFEHGDFSSLVDMMENTPKQEEEEYRACLNEARKILPTLKHPYNTLEGKQALFRKLSQKGYTTKDIRRAISEI